MKAKIGHNENELVIEPENELETDLLLSWMNKQPKIIGSDREISIHPRYGVSKKTARLLIRFEDRNKSTIGIHQK